MKLKLSILLLAISVGAFGQKPAPKTEQDFYEIKTLPIPQDLYLEVGGLATMPDGRLAVSTRRGEIWIVENPYQKDSHQTNYRRFASGLHEILGLAYKDGVFYCSQRGELTKITDTNRDGWLIYMSRFTNSNYLVITMNIPMDLFLIKTGICW